MPDDTQPCQNTLAFLFTGISRHAEERKGMPAAGKSLRFWHFSRLNGRERRSTSLAVRELVDSAVTRKRRGTLGSNQLCQFFLLKQQRCSLVTGPSHQQMTSVGYESQWQTCLWLVCLSAPGEPGCLLWIILICQLFSSKRQRCLLSPKYRGSLKHPVRE